MKKSKLLVKSEAETGSLKSGPQNTSGILRSHFLVTFISDFLSRDSSDSQRIVAQLLEERPRKTRRSTNESKVHFPIMPS